MFRRPNRTIVPQYLPPKELSLLAAAELLGDGKRAVAAQIVDLAVRKAISIAPSTSGRKRGGGFTVTLRSARDLGPDETDFIEALFGRAQPGAKMSIKPKRNGDLSRRLRVPHKRAVARLILRGFARERHWFERTPWGAKPVVPLAPAFAAVDHLWGIRDYVSFAEKDRLAFGQSPQGAQLRVEASTAQAALVLNERLLPFAVLFGLEKEWMRELGVQYAAVEDAGIHGLDVLAEVLSDPGVFDMIADLEVLDSISTAVEAVDVLEGVGAIFGGIAEGFFSGL